MLIVPPIADRLTGRLPVFLTTAVVFAAIFLGVILANSLYQMYAFMFILGFSMAGRIIVGITYLLEFTSRPFRDTILFALLICEPVYLILVTFWYQFIDHSWRILFWLNFSSITITTICSFLLLHESPKWLYINTRFDEARQILSKVAKFNGIQAR